MPAHLHTPLILQPPADLASRFPQVIRLAQDLSLKYVYRHVVTEQDLQTVGDALWRTLGADEALAAGCQAAGTRILPLILESADPLVQSLPWECLHHPEHSFLGKHPGFSLTRRLSAAPSASTEPPKGPLKVLLFTALPDDLDQEKERLDMESEQANVLEALDPLIHQGLVQLTTPDDGRFDHFRQLLREQEFHLVFLSGHGQFNADPLLGPVGAWFLFEGADGRSDRVEGEELAKAFSGTAVQTVVLSACQSGKSASADLGSSLAARLLRAGLPMWWGCGNPFWMWRAFTLPMLCARRWADRNGWMSPCKPHGDLSPSRRHWPGCARTCPARRSGVGASGACRCCTAATRRNP